MFKDKLSRNRLIIIVILIIIAILSSTVIAKYATSPENHLKTLEALDEKKAVAMKLTAAVTITSTAVSAIPGDTATFVAEQIAELADPLFLITCALYLEKFLFSTLGHVSFRILIPLVCMLGIICVIWKNKKLRDFAFKLLVFALAIYWTIPFSVSVMKTVEKTFEESINQTYGQVDDITEEAESSVEHEDTNKFLDFMEGIGDKLTGTVENAKNALGIFIDAIAVLIITTCVIPIAVIFFFIWLIKTLFGISIDLPKAKPVSQSIKKIQGVIKEKIDDIDELD